MNQPDIDYQERNSLPSRGSLTYSNGFYANCSALFVDIQDSSDLPSKHRRPTLARLYRSFISEAVAIINGDPKCREVSIVGDGAWGVFNTPYKEDVDRTLDTAGQLLSMVKVLNYELDRRGITEIRVGVGASWGRALMVKVGASGTGLDDVVYMGDVVNEAAHLSAWANQYLGDLSLMVSDNFHSNLNSDKYKNFFARSPSRGIWQADIHNIPMEEWYQENCT